ncbi:MAG TPA: PadR family transcriptional regulator [Caulobacteraceae bacterium]|jgi:DNA-binding PadR family transcriptional regulator
MKLTTLDALLLFLVSHKGQSGYDIRQLFQTTPIGLFSDSPGAIYPALNRLEMRGLLAGETTPGGRRRRAFNRTAEGDRALDAWLTAPIDPDAFTRRPQDLDLRYVMMAERLGRPAALAFLADYAAIHSRKLAALEAFVAGPGAQMSRAPREALDLGLRLSRTRQQWCQDLLSSREGETDGNEDKNQPRARA